MIKFMEYIYIYIYIYERERERERERVSERDAVLIMKTNFLFTQIVG